MKRRFLLAGLSIAVLLGASIALILAASRPPPAPAIPDPLSPPSPPVAVAPAPPGPPVAAPFRGGRLYPKAADLRPDGEPRGETSTPMANRATQKAVRRALLAASVQSRLSRCTKVGGFGGTSEVSRVPPPAPASLLLEIEARGGELRVVDAKVREWGGASPAMLSCARDVLRSQVIPAPKARVSGGERMQMHFRLNPRGDAVASR